METSIQALILGSEFSFIIKDLVEYILERKLRIAAMIDRKTFFNLVDKDGKTAERRLQIDTLTVPQSFDIGELYRIEWISGSPKPIDSMKNPILSETSPLFEIMRTNKSSQKKNGWAISHEIE